MIVYRTICAIDPGITTGWAILQALPETSTFSLVSGGEASFDQIQELAAQARACDAVVIERFMLHRGTATGVAAHDPYLITVQTIGALRALLPDCQVHFYLPSAKKMVPDKLLKALDMFTDSRHINDAIRHAIVFIEKEWRVKIEALGQKR